MKKPAKKIKAEVQTDYGVFSVTLESTPDTGGYMVRAPRVPEIITWGKNITHSKEMAREAIELTVETKVLFEAERTGKVRLVRSPVAGRILTHA